MISWFQRLKLHDSVSASHTQIQRPVVALTGITHFQGQFTVKKLAGFGDFLGSLEHERKIISLSGDLFDQPGIEVGTSQNAAVFPTADQHLRKCM